MNHIKELNNKRSYFSHISEMVYCTIKSLGLKQGNLFAIFCPMAFDGKGAYWISNSKTIQNPYLGSIYHGVSDLAKGDEKHQLCYSAGAMIRSEKHPRIIHYRSVKPILTPELLSERSGIIDNVVFPTGIDRRDDLGQSNRFDVYYGMADNRIGVERLDLPDVLPPEGVADSPKEKV